MTAVLTLAVDRHRCGLPAEAVLGLHRMVATVPLPGGPQGVDGVIDVHGEVIAVLDLRRRLGLPSRAAISDDHLVLVRVGPRTVALRTDRALDVVLLPPEACGSADDLPSAGLAGVARLADGLLLIHDVDTFLSQDEAAVLDAALDQARAGP